MLRIEPRECPECGSDIDGTADLVPGLALVSRHGKLYDWEGTTRVDWNGQLSDVDDHGLRLVLCEEGHEFRARVEEL